MHYTTAYTIDHSQQIIPMPETYATEREARDGIVTLLGARLVGQSSVGEWAWEGDYGRTGYLYVYGD